MGITNQLPMPMPMPMDIGDADENHGDDMDLDQDIGEHADDVIVLERYSRCFSNNMFCC